MKSIKNYFTSPKEQVEENGNTNPVECKQEQAKKKRKKKRKHSDPAITDVAQLLTDNLKFSPNNITQTKLISLENTPKNEVVTTDDILINTKENKRSNVAGGIIKECKLKISNNSPLEIDSIKRETKENKTCKLNAFQFMMDKRNKSIGSNSPGKHLDKELPLDEGKNKEKLAARRHLFSNWSELKGGEKRKRLEQEKDEIIKHKLNERTKRFKKLLKVDKNEKTETLKRKRSRRISSSSEDNDDFEKKEAKQNILRKKGGGTKKNYVKDDTSIGKCTRDGFSDIKNPLTENRVIKMENNNGKLDKTGNLLSFIKSEQKEKKNKTKKHSKDEKYDKKQQKDPTGNESNQERTLRSWKLKIKLKTDDLNDEKSSQKPPVDYLELSSSDLDECVDLSSDSEDKKMVKIAPVFHKSLPKPKEDPAIAEARKQFLMSGIPSSLKKIIDRQNSFIDQQDAFPVTSHVQQKCDSSFWNLPPVRLKLLDDAPISIRKDLICEKIIGSDRIGGANTENRVGKFVDSGMVLRKIKKENPDYPVIKSFRQICGSKSGVIEGDGASGRRKKGKKVNGGSVVENFGGNWCMWTEKYKPKTSNEILGNSQAIKRLKKWLEDWEQFSNEINLGGKTETRSSESEFETTDCDSRDSSKLPGKIIILEGPCGTGKTMSVYAVCNELGYNVIELNASNKRTGKRLLQELQEATQSHQVRKKESFFQSSTKESLKNHKMCLLLIEDVDLVFEQDDGFVNALLQLTATTKRPIIATTNDYYSIFVQKYFGTFEFIHFSPLSSFSLATWLQIVFLVEGSYVCRNEIGSLLEYNKGDVRKTLLQLQFWLQSQPKPNLIKIEDKINYNEKFTDVDNSIEEKSYKKCISVSEIFQMDQPFLIPFTLDLLWWNIFSNERLDNFQETVVNSDSDKVGLVSLGKVFDSLSCVDVMCKNVSCYKEGNIKVRDSLELCETFNCYDDPEFLHELTSYLMNGYISKYGDNKNKLDPALPDRTERRWKTTLQEYENEFKKALLLSTDKKSSTLDYLPALRHITRSESVRAASNTKRGNRFRNYLKDLGVKCQDKTITNACRIFNNHFSI
ncbi:enhanced level of genomic instability 1 [Diorhabda sublineata]|uniref:enhanced level of genomic instability 1 n=1 Tax=Diorhabda sublineata TaxID=1163346 RepID=UPI0024E0F17C|nr:enhanced level of genomic instability 1 [Diorhabda sublineata]